ncbi:12672_t:CDS:10, partial [Acaulospora morrowiae]
SPYYLTFQVVASMLHSTSTSSAETLIEDKPISQKVSRLLTNSIDDTKMKTSLEALSEFYTVNSIEERRNLRRNIGQKAIETNGVFLEIFGKVIKQLEVIESEIKEMNTFCDEVSKSLDSANRQTSLLLEQSDNLKSQRETCKTRKILIDAFLERFTLSEKEVSLLSSPEAEITPEFFEALKHLQRIHRDCESLLITENQRAGLEIMERMNSYKETAFDKLYRWTQKESRDLGHEVQEIPVALRYALKALKQRPVLFQSCLEELVHVRRNAITRLFIEALTRGGPGGTPRPIEMLAHDPLRYVGDMLAWVHQNVASEKEYLEGLFEPKKQEVETNDKEVTWESDDIIIQDLLDRNLDGTCRSLKTPGSDLMPPPAVKETVLQLREIMTSYETSLVTVTEREEDFRAVLDAILDPLFQMCELGTKDLSRFKQAIYMINCLYCVQSSLTMYSFTHGRVMSLERQIEENMEILVDGQYTKLLKQSGLGPIVRAMETRDENTPLSLMSNMDTNSLTNIMARLDSFLSLADSDTFKLQGIPPELTKKVNKRVGKMFVETYKRISDAIKDPKNRYEFPATILAKTVDEIENILVVD